MSRTIGIIGVGEIASAIVEGVCASEAIPGATNARPRFALSPRSVQRSTRLAADFDGVDVCESNQEVVDRSDIVFLSVLPEQTESVLAGLDVPSDRTLISAIAGVSTERLAASLPHSPAIVRVIPLPAVRDRQGVTAIFPAHAFTQELFDTLGGTVVAETEDMFNTLSGATATMSAYYAFLKVVADWLEAQGWADTDADRVVRGLFVGLGNTLARSDAPIADLIEGHETPGGLNAMLRAEWMDGDNRNRLTVALNHVLHRVSGTAEG